MGGAVKPLAAVREYHYWSERLTNTIWQDNVVRLPDKINLSVGIANFSAQTSQQEAPQTRAARANTIEQLLSDHIVRNLDYQGPVTFLSGRSQTMILSSLRNPDSSETGAVTLYTTMQNAQGRRIAICLFGSASNVCGCEPSVPTWRRFGWTSSSTNGVELLLKCAANAEESEIPAEFWRKASTETRATPQEICWDALNICHGQGQYHGHDCRPWHRGFTIGHYHDVEWLAQIYFSFEDVDRNYFDEETDVVHVGAAFWVRSGSPHSLIPYDFNTIPKLDASEYPPLARPLARVRSRLRGQHLQHRRLSIEHPDWY
jgi:hypothetical protein